MVLDVAPDQPTKIIMVLDFAPEQPTNANKLLKECMFEWLCAAAFEEICSIKTDARDMLYEKCIHKAGQIEFDE